MPKELYFDPSQLAHTSLAERNAIAKSIAKLLESLSDVDRITRHCPMHTECYELRQRIKLAVETYGWIITTPKNKFRVTPPNMGNRWVRYGIDGVGNFAAQIPMSGDILYHVQKIVRRKHPGKTLMGCAPLVTTQ